MNIGEAAAAAGITAKMVRYYESIGLIDAPARTASGYRRYTAADIHVLRFIGRARDLGFAMDSVARLLDLWRDTARSSAEVKALADAHVKALQRRVDDLQAMIRTLSDLSDRCCGDARPDCPILNDLSGQPPPGVSIEMKEPL